MSKTKKVKAFYFSMDDRTLRYGDNRNIVIGKSHTVKGDIVLCENGLHASERLIDALSYAPGKILYQVELSGRFDIGDNKLCASKRLYLDGFDAENILREFSRRQAMINIEKVKPYATSEQYELICKYLNSGDESIKIAARSAAESAARSAARSAAWSAAWSAARSAAESEQNKMLTEMVKEATGWDI